jgi:uncharacterized membrane-anchored protein YitT (DUF2179 family)
MKKINFKKELRTLGGTLLGTFVIAIGILYFIDPAELYTGGVTGLAQLIVNITRQVSGGSVLINLGLLTFLFQIPLMILGYVKLSKRFIFYTILSVVVVSGLLALPISFPVMGEDHLAAGLVGGILTGLGNGILYKVGASSGGTAILFQYLSIKTGKSVGIYQILIHGIIILIAGIQFSLAVAVYTLISQLLSAIVVDKVYTSYHFVKLEIITDQGTQMADALAHKLPHGVTYLNAVGAYTKKDNSIVSVVISFHELTMYKEFIESIDPKAFVVVIGVENVLGNFKKGKII